MSPFFFNFAKKNQKILNVAAPQPNRASMQHRLHPVALPPPLPSAINNAASPPPSDTSTQRHLHAAPPPPSDVAMQRRVRRGCIRVDTGLGPGRRE
jgi:hypothetical protein